MLDYNEWLQQISGHRSENYFTHLTWDNDNYSNSSHNCKSFHAVNTMTNIILIFNYYPS